ncbi:TonB-dependent receptor [Phenylobacterium sp. 58.2.17]|uniref:TonB-dependent receptor n=1 Tax=Phenylobacterium sp. 58.2.17 TaxID=2969306 RepID=UPI002264DB5F|nr:TonB-dependent receptor [Phenylobacterium sp. 58.2.17]MCX7587350.1 TonB-dependent receptor [Phenylobacterium sp. 58.2.17]
MQVHHLKIMALASSAAVALVGSAAWAQAPARAQFDIPAQDLGAALRSLGVQAGREVLFDPSLVDGRRAPAVHGEMAVSSAVERLLAGQALRSRESGRTIVIERAPGRVAVSKVSAPGPLVAAGEPVEAAEVEEIVVVGSNLAGVTERGLLPVSVVDRSELEMSGAVTAGEMIASLPQSGGQAFNNEQQGPNQARGDVASANLRGIGSGNTLVLLDGRRMVGHPGTQQEGSVPVQVVNLNTIPATALKRVEVLRDGGGAIYGSDAVAGVLNNVLDDNYVGGQIVARYGGSEGTNLTETSLGAKLGRDFNDGATHVALFGEYFDRTAMPASDRDYAATDYLGNRVPAQYAGSFDNRSSLTPWLTGRVGTAVTNFGPSFTAFHMQPCSYTGSDAQVGGGVCIDGGSATLDTSLRTDEGPERTMSPSSERYSLMAVASHDFGQVEWFGQALYYGATSSSVRGGTTNLTSAPLTIGANNPYNPFGSGPGRLAGYTGPAQAITVVGLRVDDVGRRRIDVDSDAYRLLSGLRGDLGDWSWESALLYSHARTKDVESNRVSNTALQAALNSSDPSRAYNPFNGGDLANVGGFDATSNPASVVDPLRVSITRDGTTSLALWGAKISNPQAFTLWDRDIGLAFGAEWRRETFKDDRDPRIDGTITFATAGGPTSDAMGSSPTPDTSGSRKVFSAYAELQTSLIPEGADIPLVRSLDLQLAARFEDYSDIDEQILKPKVALGWRLNDYLLVRAAYSQGFRAPNLETVNASEIRRVQENLTDYYSCAVAQGVTQFSALNRSACSAYRYNVEDVRAGNKDLKSETSDNFSAGVVFTPTPDLMFSIDWWRIEQDGVVGVFESQDHLNLDAIGRLGGSGPNPALTRNALGEPIRIANQFLNLDSRTIEGIDVGATWRIDGTQFGDFRLGLDVALLQKFDQTPSAEAAALLAAGLPASAGGSLIEQDDNPRTRGQAYVTWSSGPWEVSGYARYVGVVKDSSALLYKGDDWLTFNASVGYAPDEGVLNGMAFRVGVNNIADKDPPLADETFGYFTKLYSNRGRYWFAQVSKSF